MQNANPIQYVTVNELATILFNTPMVKGMGNFITISTLTEPRCTKFVRNTSPKIPFTDKIEKLSGYPAILNVDYKVRVLNQLEKEGKDKSEYKAGRNTMPLDFSKSKNNFIGTFTPKNSTIEEPVIMTFPRLSESEIDTDYIDMWERFKEDNKPYTLYFRNGNKVEKSTLPDVLPVRNKAKNQGTDKEIIVRKIYLKNVKEISINGFHYILTK